MADKKFNEIMGKWQEGLDQTVDLYQDGQKSMLHASECFFDGLHFVSELFGNQQMAEIYKTISKHFNDIGKDIDEKKKK